MADRLWGIVLFLVVVIVLLGSIRLVMQNWSYLALLAVAVAAALYIIIQLQHALKSPK